MDEILRVIKDDSEIQDNQQGKKGVMINLY